MADKGCSTPPASESAADDSAKAVLNALPQWLQPGVSRTIHYALQTVLFSLNILLATCVAFRVFSPHFEIMLLLSIALTVCYFMFMAEIGKLHLAARGETEESGDKKDK